MTATGSWPFPTHLLTEGATRLEVPITCNLKGPASSRETPVFYNPAMALSRDLNVLLARGLLEMGQWPAGPCLDGLTASGVRGLRLAREARLSQVVLNDVNPLAARLAAHNVTLNELAPRVEVTRERLQVLLAQRSFTVIDLDPFGTPAPFLDGALQALRNHGLLALSATDLPALCGAQPRVCQRRYQARPLRGPAGSEFGVRLLMGWVARRAAVFDWGIEPLLAFAEGHHLRLYLRLRRGAGRADASLEQLGYVHRPPGRGFRLEEEPEAQHETTRGGPFWLGRLAQRELLSHMGRLAAGVTPEQVARPSQLLATVTRWQAEHGMEPTPVGFYTLDELARAAHCGPPSMVRFLEALEAAGHPATRTSFDPTGVRTFADWTSCVDLVAELQR